MPSIDGKLKYSFIPNMMGIPNKGVEDMNPNLINLIINLVLAVVTGFFIYKDARARDFNWLMWTILPATVFFGSGIVSSLLILLLLMGVYLFSRPKGPLTACPHCKKRIHSILAFCPFCRNSVKRECLRCHETVDWEATRCPHCRSTNLTDS